MELRALRPARLAARTPYARLAAVALAALVSLAAAQGAGAVPAAPGPLSAAGADSTQGAAPRPRRLARPAVSDRQAIAIARRAPKIRDELARRPRMRPQAIWLGRHWQVRFFQGDIARAHVLVHGTSGRASDAWTGPQVAWKMARGYEGAFGRTFNAPYVWLPLALLFLAPFVDVRRPFRLLHLDLLMLLGFGLSHVFFNRGEISTSVPLVYPVLLYVLARMLWTGFRWRARPDPLVPHAPIAWLVVVALVLVAFRVTLNVVDSNVIDVGYAGVVGADRIMDGDPLYGQDLARNLSHGDTYGPLAYLAYVPFEQALPWGGAWDGLPAAHAAAIAFDLLTMLALYLLGLRLRRGRDGTVLGVALAYAWAAYPYSLFVLSTNSNDSLVALLVVLSLLAVSSAPARGALVALAGATKLAPFALAPLFARATGRLRAGRSVAFAVAFAAALAAVVLPFLPDGGMRELYDRTLGFQVGRDSPFSIWGQYASLDGLRVAIEVAAVALALLLAAVPRERSVERLAALAAAVLIALQLAAVHWFYLYVVWFAPAVLVALFARHPSVHSVRALAPPVLRQQPPQPTEEAAVA